MRITIMVDMTARRVVIRLSSMAFKRNNPIAVLLMSELVISLPTLFYSDYQVSLGSLNWVLFNIVLYYLGRLILVYSVKTQDLLGYTDRLVNNL